MKKAFFLMLITACILCFVSIKPFLFGIKSSDSSGDSEKFFKIRICKVIEHEAINAVVDGIKDYLKQISSESTYHLKTCKKEHMKYLWKHAREIWLLPRRLSPSLPHLIRM